MSFDQYCRTVWVTCGEILSQLEVDYVRGESCSLVLHIVNQFAMDNFSVVDRVRVFQWPLSPTCLGWLRFLGDLRRLLLGRVAEMVWPMM